MSIPARIIRHDTTAVPVAESLLHGVFKSEGATILGSRTKAFAEHWRGRFEAERIRVGSIRAHREGQSPRHFPYRRVRKPAYRCGDPDLARVRDRLVAGPMSLELACPCRRLLRQRSAERGDVLDDSRKLVEGELGLDGTFEIRGLVHAVDGRGLLILTEREPAGGKNRLAAVDAVAAHAGHQEADGRALIHLGRRSEQHVDGRPVAADRRIVARARRAREAARL